MEQKSTTITQEKRYKHCEGRMNGVKRKAAQTSSFRGITVIERRTGCGSFKYQTDDCGKWEI